MGDSDVDVAGSFQLDPFVDMWEQQPDEPTKYYGAFVAYTRQAKRVDSRSGEPLPRKLSYLIRDGAVDWSHRHLRRIATEYMWEERAAAWDLDREHQLGGQIADARLAVMKSRIELLAELRVLTVEVLKAKEPSDWKMRDLIELLKVQLTAEDNLLGLGGRPSTYNGTQVGVDISLPMGENTTVIESQIEDIMAELEARSSRRAATDTGSDEVDD